MSCTVKSLPLPYTTVAHNSTTQVVVPAGTWVSAAGISGGRGWGEIAARNGNLQAAPGVQFTNDPFDSPTGNVTAVGSVLSTDGTTHPAGVTALSSGAYRFARPVWILSLSSGTGLATACVGGVVELIYG